jgi:hypothetical protein
LNKSGAIGFFLQDQLRNSPRLFTSQTKVLFFKQQNNNHDRPIDMTLGWHIGRADGLQYFFKEGDGGGFHSEMRVSSAQGIASVVIVNNTSFDAKGFLNALDKEFQHR